jgi:hypothetical protein
MTSGSYLDALVLGNNCHIFQSTGCFVTVYRYDIALGGHKRAIVSGCFANDDHHIGHPVLLIVHQGLRVPGAAHSLIPPFQMQDNDIVVNNCSKSQCIRPTTANNHSLIIPRSDGEEPYPRIPLSLWGTITCVPVRRPTQEEFRDETLERFELTYATPKWEHWDPMMLAELEESLLRSGEYTDSSGDPLFPVDLDNTIDDPGILSVTMEDRFSDWNHTIASMGSIYLPGTLYTALRDCVVWTVLTDRRSKHSYITPEVLA